ncbi:hypothetical protein TeGR_g9267 [Tetraparma gracilis]|uniref:Endosomal/lysosomal potassium channel TMEM175 n=1 Tax=Tetraparma gracilis TaxID=2962635 RepID=A0ABQ6MBT4_9STRA|nr:hypothetical protein TeGR_g9267 [Tetraparma gracilis]
MPVATRLHRRDSSEFSSEHVAVSFTELFFDLAIVSATARLSEFLGPSEEEEAHESEKLNVGVRFFVLMFSFWYNWHYSNLLHNVTFSTGFFTSALLCLKIIALCQMATAVTAHPTASSDLRFGWYNVASRTVDLVLILRVYWNAARNVGHEAVAAGFMVNAIGVLLELSMWVCCLTLFSTPSSLISAFGVSDLITILLVRPASQLLWKSFGDKSRDNQTSFVKFNTQHFRERQALLIILVLGEAVAASTISSEAGTATAALTVVSAVSISFAYMLKSLYLDSPDPQSFCSELASIEGSPRRATTAPSSLQRLGLFVFAPLHYFLLGSVTAFASCVRLALAADGGPNVAGYSSPLFLSAAVSLAANGVIKLVNYDHPGMDSLRGGWPADPRFLAEAAAASVYLACSYAQFEGEAGRAWALVALAAPLGAALLLERMWTRRVLANAKKQLELSESAVAVGGGLMGEESLLVDDSLIA